MAVSLKSLLTNWRIILLAIALFISVYTINPYWILQPGTDMDGAAIRSVEPNSSASLAGFQNPSQDDQPMNREIITEVNGKRVKSLADYAESTKGLMPGDTVKIKTLTNWANPAARSLTKKPREYTVAVMPLYRYTETNETEEAVVEETVLVNKSINGTLQGVNITVNRTVEVPVIEREVIGAEDIGLKAYDAPGTNIKKGLDLQGGTRVLLQPQEKVSEIDLDLIIQGLQERINVYGLRDIVVRKVSTPLTDDVYIMVEVAGANEDEVKDLISRQGKFEAKIRNDTAFRGGDDIKFVCKSADCAFPVTPQRPCSMVSEGQYQCTFEFSIKLSAEAAQRQADLTGRLSVSTENGFEYLNESIDLYLDDELVDSLRIGASLKGVATQDIAISGPGFGSTVQEAASESGKNMKRLQTILITGSLPVRLEIVKIDTISPLLGREFLKNAFILGLLATLAVSAVVVVRYRSLKIALPVMLTMLAEVILLLGIAAMSKSWNIDLAAIAGIIIAVGTGVDHQIVITDEALKKKGEVILNWKDRIGRAFVIIMAAYFTTVVAMLPLLWAGAGLLKGFAISTIIGVTLGVFITRPAFAVMIEALLKE